MDYLCMNFTLCYPTVPKNDEDSMSDGLYRPYFHGELVAEYRKSIASRKPSTSGAEAQNHIEKIEDYVEPGITCVRNLRYTQSE